MKTRDGTDASIPSTMRLFLTVLTISFLAEAAIMLVLPGYHAPAEAFLDASLLVLLSAPPLWWLVVRPLRRAALAEHLRAATIVANAMDGIITMNEQGLVESFNPAAERIFGYGAAELVGQPVTRLMPERYRDAHQRGLERLRAGGEPQIIGKTVELHGLRKDGTEFPLEISLAKWDTSRGVLFIGDIRDISERKRREESLRETSETLRAVIHASPLAITTLDSEGRVNLWNPAARRIFGWSEQEVLGCPLPIVPADKQEEFQALRHRVLEGEAFSGVEVRRQKRDGSAIDTSISAAPLRDASGEIVGILGVLEDITERKTAEGRLRLQSAALESASNAIMMTDREGRIVWVNPAFSRLTGYTLEELFGQAPRVLKSGNHDAAFYQTLWETILSGQVWQSEIVNRRKDGSLYTEEQTITPVRDERGEIKHFIAIHHDITERKRAEETLQALYQASLQIQEPLHLRGRLNRLLATARDVLHLDRMNILLADPEGEWLEGVASLGTKEPAEILRVPIGPEGGGVAQAYLTQQPVIWTDPQVPVSEHLRLKPPYNRWEAFRSRAFIILPLVIQGRAIGVLGADRKHSRRPLEPATLELLQLFAAQAAVAIEQARLYEAVQAEAQREAALRTVAEALTANLGSEAIFQVMVEKAVEVAQAEKGTLFAFDPQEQELRTVAHVGLSPAIRSLRFKVGESVTGRAVMWRRPIAIPDVETDTEHEVRVDFARREGIRALLTLPLISKEQVVGALSVYYAMPHAFSADEIARLTLYAHQAAIAIENARLFAATEQRASELAALQEIGQAVTSRLELPAVLEAVVAGAMRLLDTQHTQIILWDEATQSLRFGAAVGTEAERVRNQKYKLGLGINGTVALTRQPMILDDYQASPYVVPECFDVVATITVPVLFGDRLLGVLHSHTTQPGRCFTPDDLRRLQMLATQAAIAIENARLYDGERRRALELQTVMGVSRDVIGQRPLDAFLQDVVGRAVAITRAHSGTLYLWDGKAEVLRPRAWVNLGDYMRDMRYPLGRGITGTAAAKGRGVIWNEYASHPHHDPKLLQHISLAACMAAPLKIRDQLIGVLTLNADEPGRHFAPADLTLLETFASQMAVALENARLYEEKRLAAIQLEATVEERTRELKDANAQLREAMGQVEEVSRHKSEFLANMSHELRTPLNSIIGFAELVGEQRVGPLTEKQARFLGHIHNSGKHLLQLISDILDLSKVEAGKFVLQPEPLPVAQTLEDILVIARGLANKKAQTVEAEIAPDLPPLQADPVRFKQICFNLLSNAVKFTPEQGTIRLTARKLGSEDAKNRSSLPASQRPSLPTEEWLEISVTDTGIGIRPEDLPRLFQEFVQLETTRDQKHEGTGLGLALTKRLVDLHGGRIWAESEGEGRGSTFIVLLPFRGPGVSPEAQGTIRAKTGGGEGGDN